MEPRTKDIIHDYIRSVFEGEVINFKSNPNQQSFEQLVHVAEDYLVIATQRKKQVTKDEEF
jgi:hypothetical protein